MSKGRRRLVFLAIGVLVVWVVSLLGAYVLGNAIGEARIKSKVNLALCQSSLQRQQDLEKARIDLGREPVVTLPIFNEQERLEKELTAVEGDIARFCSQGTAPHQPVRKGLRPFSPPSPP